MPNGRMGHPPGPIKLTSEVTKAICDALELCMPDKYAAESAGISDRTFQLWMSKGQSGDPDYTDFVSAISRARAQAVKNMHVRGLSGGKGSSAALWMLERRYWREYGQRLRVDTPPPDPLDGIDEDSLGAAIKENRDRVKAYERVRDLLAQKEATPPQGE